MSKFQKIGFSFIFLIAFAVKANAQILSTANLNLNAGGYVNDVIYDPYHDCYIVVGKFTSINSVPDTNISFINSQTLAVLNTSYLKPIVNIDGEIRCVAITKTSIGATAYYNLYLGGNFSSVQANNGTFVRNGIVKLTSNHSIFAPITSSSNFTVSAWDADLDMTPLLTGYNSEGVDDILITNDTVIFSGRFFAVNSSTAWDQRDGLAAYTIGGTLLAYPNFSSAGTYISSRFFTINKFGANLFVGGYVDGGFGYDGRLLKTDANGNILAGFNYNSANLKTVFNFYELDDSLLIVADDRNANNNQPDNVRVYRQSNGSEKLDHSLSPQSGLIGGVTTHNNLAQYKQYSFVSSTQVGYSVISYENNFTTVPVSGVDWNAAATNSLTVTYFSHVHAAGSHLFVSAPNLTTLSGASKLRLGVYCLEPADAKFFTTSDSTICPDQIITYAIPDVEFADGYKWEYTGNGGYLDGYGPLNSFIEVNDPNLNSAQIYFTSAFTPGQLKVTPYSLCNGTQKIYSNTISTNIISNPLPHVNAGPDTVINCYNDTIGLYGYSDSVVATYEWVYNGFDNIFSQFDTVESDGDYIFKVTNALGCPNYDTVHVAYDTITPIAILPLSPYELTCAIPVKDFLGSTLAPNTTSYWIDLLDTLMTPQPNPISIDAEGGFQFIVQDTLNGCFQPVGIYVNMNIDQPTIILPDYPVFNIAYAIDTIFCNPNFLNLVCSSSTANTTSTWINSDTTLFFGDTMNVTSAGNYTAFATDNSNGCTNTLTINIASFQNVPGIELFADNELNCSVDSLILDGSSMSAGAVLEWSGMTIPITPNPLIVYNPGTYYLTVTNPDNGCVSTDSTVISETNSINVSAGNNQLACDQDFVNLIATYTGNITGINYLWNTGTTTSNEIYTAGNSPYGAVEVFGDNGCYGVDTVYINLPPNPVINFQGFKPCDDGPSGQIVATPVSGTEPFQYSIDGGINYQTSPVFGGLYIGTYPIWVKDSLLCDYLYQAVIDENSSLPEPKFLFSTYNFASDTVMIIDVSNPPTDSTVWEFPSEIIVLNNDVLSPTILLPDTGVFQITMKAYYGNCLVELTKPIYAAMFDSTAANYYNQNGIKSIELYPNPTSGNFTVTVEFYKSQRAAMVVQDMIGNTYVYNEYDETLTITQDVFLDLSVQDGTYVLKLISEFDSVYITFILAR